MHALSTACSFRLKGGALVGTTKKGKGTKLMVVADGAGTALGVPVEQTTPAEVRLLGPTLTHGRIGGCRAKRRRPKRLIADRGYDSNKARALLIKRAIEPIIPPRRSNTIATHQDGRKLRRYKRRWIIERTNAWLQNFRRLVARYERSATSFTALIHMACALITLKRVLG
jgi:transposase